MAIITSKPKIHRLSGDESKILDSVFGLSDDDMDMGLADVDMDGFTTVEARKDTLPKRRSFDETRMVPFTVTTDVNTATQVMMLLEMIRYCMENSKEVLDTTTGEAKEYSITLKVRNRSKTPFVISIGDEPMPPIPFTKDDFPIGN